MAKLDVHYITCALLVAPMSVQDESLFVNDIEAARCVLLAPHRIPLNEFTSLRKKPEDRGGLFPVWGYSWVQPENTTTQSQAEDLAMLQKLSELRHDRLLSYLLDQRDLRIEFAHLIAKRQLHSSKSSAHDEGGYGSVNPGTVHRKAAKKPRTTYAPAVVDPRYQQPSGSQPGAGLPAPTSSVTRGNAATSQAAGASQSAAALGRPAPHGSGARRSDQGRQEELSHAYDDEIRQLRDRVYAIEIAIGFGPAGQAADQTGKPGALEVLHRYLDALGRETHERHGRVDRLVPASALKELRQGLDALSHEVHGRMPSYEPQWYSYHSAYGYNSYTSSYHSVPSYSRTMPDFAFSAKKASMTSHCSR
ncbi:LOW QUALITY PROTEIN: Hypothetical protein PHPALM_19385, partial [Phytophthora palmivora]